MPGVASRPRRPGRQEASQAVYLRRPESRYAQLGKAFRGRRTEARPAILGRSRHNPRRALFYALDPATGDELYTSGDSMDSWNHYGGIALSDGNVYLSGYDARVF